MNVSVPAFASEDAVRTYQPDPAKPRPVVIFVSARFSYGVAWDIVPPLPVPSTSTAHARYRYALSEDEAFVTIERVEGGVAEELEREWAMETVGGMVKEERVLLGSTRPLVCTVVRPSAGGGGGGGGGAGPPSSSGGNAGGCCGGGGQTGAAAASEQGRAVVGTPFSGMGGVGAYAAGPGPGPGPGPSPADVFVRSKVCVFVLELGLRG